MFDMTTGKPIKVILKFTIPILIGALFNLFYNLADIRIIGSYLGDGGITSVGAVSTFSDLIVGFLTGVANGFAVITARFYGMHDEKNVKKCFSMSMFLGIIASLFIMALSLISLKKILDFMNVTGEYRADSYDYMRVILYGLIFMTLYNVLAASLRAVGDSFTPLIFLIVSVVLNVFFDIAAVGFMDLGVKGAAYATIIAQFISALSCFIYMEIRYPNLRVKPSDLVPDKKCIRRLIPAGCSMGFMSCLISFGTVALQSSINSLGDLIIEAHITTRKLTSIFFLPFSVLGTSMATYSGQNYGAGKIDRVKKGLISVIVFTFGWCAVIMLAAYTIAPDLIVMITKTDIKEVIETASRYQRVDTLFTPVVTIVIIFRNCLQGLGDHISPIISSSLELVGKIVFAFIFTPIFGYWAIIFAEPISWIIMVVPLIVSMTKKLKMIQKTA